MHELSGRADRQRSLLPGVREPQPPRPPAPEVRGRPRRSPRSAGAPRLPTGRGPLLPAVLGRGGPRRSLLRRLRPVAGPAPGGRRPGRVPRLLDRARPRRGAPLPPRPVLRPRRAGTAAPPVGRRGRRRPGRGGGILGDRPRRGGDRARARSRHLVGSGPARRTGDGHPPRAHLHRVVRAQLPEPPRARGARPAVRPGVGALVVVRPAREPGRSQGARRRPLPGERPGRPAALAGVAPPHGAAPRQRLVGGAAVLARPARGHPVGAGRRHVRRGDAGARLPHPPARRRHVVARLGARRGGDEPAAGASGGSRPGTPPRPSRPRALTPLPVGDRRARRRPRRAGTAGVRGPVL